MVRLESTMSNMQKRPKANIRLIKNIKLFIFFFLKFQYKKTIDLIFYTILIII